MFSPEMKNFSNPLPPEKVHFIDLKAEPWEDQTRIKIFVKISEFTTPPNLNFSMLNKMNETVSEVTLIENVDADIVFTMHIRNNSFKDLKILKGEIFYSEEIGTVDTASIEF